MTNPALACDQCHPRRRIGLLCNEQPPVYLGPKQGMRAI
jgi:hypothetical protein